MQLEALLKSFGLSGNETKIYLQLMKAVESSAYEIAQSTKIPRATVYLTLDSLIGQGLVSKFRKNNVAYFAAESPSRLAQIAESKAELAKRAIPLLQATMGAEMDQPETKMYVGIEGVKRVFEDMLESARDGKTREFLCMSHPDIYAALPKFFPSWVEKRRKLGVVNRIILPAKAKGHPESRTAGLLREIRFSPLQSTFKLTQYLYGDCAAFFSFDGTPYAIVIKSKTIVSALHEIFGLLWSTSEPLNDKKKTA